MSVESKRPLPTAEGKMAPFWRAALDGVLVVQRCSDCGQHRFPASDICAECLGANLEWVPAAGAAELYSFVVMHHTVDPYFADRVPYIVADVKLLEGPHLIATVVGESEKDLRIGQRLAVEFERVSEEINLPVFRRSAD
jgi:uncharacterized OB-fold protein